MTNLRHLRVTKFFNGFVILRILILSICFLFFGAQQTIGQGKGAKQQDKKDKNEEDAEKGKNQESPNNKIVICHKGKSIEVSESALKGHLKHGDQIGSCFTGDLDGKISPYYEPPKEKVDEEIGAELTSLVKKFNELGSVPSDDIYVLSGERVLIEVIAEDVSSISIIEDYFATNYAEAIVYPDYGMTIILPNIQTTA